MNILRYKMEWAGKHLVLVGRWFPSSKLCSNCGYINDDLKLEDRKWVCPKCGVLHDRDVNSSKTPKPEEIRILKENSITITVPSERREFTPLEIV